ncbi:DUF6088 family protein [Fulvivirgaceae bacterium BMA12]|uniref:DUF6088 family protein n=1 Tax=Agaribacillus aureus TaxID=3051825 RepID=A0ABT8LAB4_9BACT|nr:DUF6088 family protein [Fulvivirgaceae bacterium BMA12]
MPIKQTLEGKMRYRIKRGRDSVYIPSDFFDLSDRDQVGRVLRQFIKKGMLIKLGQGIYARAKLSSLTGKPVPEKDLRSLALEALKKLGIKTAPSSQEQAYNRGQSTQVPTGRVIGVRDRISRTIGYNGRFIKYERITR